MPPLYATTVHHHYATSSVCHHCMPPLYATTACHHCMPPLYAITACHHCMPPLCRLVCMPPLHATTILPRLYATTMGSYNSRFIIVKNCSIFFQSRNREFTSCLMLQWRPVCMLSSSPNGLVFFKKRNIFILIYFSRDTMALSRGWSRYMVIYLLYFSHHNLAK